MKDHDEQFTLNGARIESLDEFVMRHNLEDETTGLLLELQPGEPFTIYGIGTVRREVTP